MIGSAGYEIRVRGTLDRRWWEWFEDYAITTEPSGETRLSGRVSDQRSLLGTLVTLYELGHALVSITSASHEPEN